MAVEREGITYTSSSDSPGGKNTHERWLSGTQQVCYTSRHRTQRLKCCTCWLCPRPHRHLATCSLLPVLPFSSQPGLTEPWKSPNFSFWYFKANKPPVKKSTHPSASCDLGQQDHRFYQVFLCSVAVENAQHQTREVKLNKMPLKTELLRQH